MGNKNGNGSINSYQLGPDGKPLSLEKFYFADEEGRGINFNKFQLREEWLALKAMEKGVFTKLMWPIVAEASKCKSYEDIKPLVEGKIKALFNEDKIFKKLYSKDESSLEQFSESIASIASFLKRVKLDEGMPNFSRFLKTKMQDDIYSKGYLKTPEELVSKTDIESYEKAYDTFLNGKYNPETNKFIIGWNELQDAVYNEIKQSNKKLKVLEKELLDHPHTKIAQKAASNKIDYSKSIRSIKNQGLAKSALGNDSGYTEKIQEYTDLFKQANKWSKLHEAIENFRNEDTKFDDAPELWQPFFEKFKTKMVKGKEVEIELPQQVIPESPYVKQANKLGKIIGFRIESAGIKTYQSIFGKLSNPRFLETGTSGIYDGYRLALVFEKLEGVAYFMRNMKDSAEKCGFIVKPSKPELSNAMLHSDKNNFVITELIEDAEGNKSPHTRVGEFKYYGANQWKTKKPADGFYKLYCKMCPEDSNEKRRPLELNNAINMLKAEDVHSDLVIKLSKKLSKDNSLTVLELINQSGLSFGFDINNLNEFLIQKNFNKAANLVLDIERVINTNSLSKEDIKIKKSAYSSLIKDSKPVAKKNPDGTLSTDENGNAQLKKPKFDLKAMQFFINSVFSGEEKKKLLSQFIA